eukprot:Gb_04891 [translate_table: standard]
MAMASAFPVSIASPTVFPFSNVNTGVYIAPPKCTHLGMKRKLQRNSSFKIAALAAGNGDSCCGGGGSSRSNGGSCSSHGKSSVPDLSNVGKEFEAMVARATLSEIEKEYKTQQMKGNITRDVMQEVMHTGPETSVRKRTGEAVIDLGAMLTEAKNATKNEDFVFDNAEDVFV